MTALPAISDFLKDTLGESLKKPLQPSGLFVGAIFVFLNLFFIFPALQDSVPIVGEFLKLDTGWQLVLALVATLIIAYLVLSVSSSVLRVLSGELWSDSPVLGRFLLWRQKRRLSQRESVMEDHRAAIEKLEGEIAELEEAKAKSPDSQAGDARDKEIQTKTAQRTDRESAFLARGSDREANFPAEASYLAPTALGNILNATSSRVWQRYHIDMGALWSHMETVIAEKTAIASRIDNSKATLDFLLNLAAVLTLFGVEYLIVSLAQQQGRAGLAAFIFWLLAYLLYRAAWGRARAWGDAVQMAFDLYRDDLRKALGMRTFASQKDELEVWEKASGWLLWGDQAAEIFASEPPAAASVLTLSASDNVRVKYEKRICDADERRPPQGAARRIELISHMDYWLTVTNPVAGSGEQDMPAADGVFVTLSDPRVPQITTPPTGVLLGTNPETITARLMPADRANPCSQLLWHIGRVPAHGARVLYYRLPISTDTVELTTNADNLVVTETISPSSGQVTYRYELKVKNLGAPLEATLEVTDGRVKLPTKLPIGSVEVQNDSGEVLRHDPLQPERQVIPDRYVWPLGLLNTNETAILTYDV